MSNAAPKIILNGGFSGAVENFKPTENGLLGDYYRTISDSQSNGTMVNFSAGCFSFPSLAFS